MQTQPVANRGVRWMQVAYGLAVLLTAAALMKPGGVRHAVAGLAFLLVGFVLIGTRMPPLSRLALGLSGIAAVAVGVAGEPIAVMGTVSATTLFLLAFAAPTWLSPTLLALVFAVEAWLSPAPLPDRVLFVAAVGVQALAFGLLADHQKKRDRERRELYTTSGELTQSLRQVEYLAMHDPLTGLPNRRNLTRRLETSVRRAQEQGEVLAVAFVDLDRFKAVNDGAGHGYGDRVLKAVATAIARRLHPGDVLGRQGGDEFILLISSADSERDAYERIDGLRRGLAEGVTVNGEQVFATASFGVAFYPDDGTSADDLLRHADLALYRAKDEGRNRVSLFNAELEQEASTAFYLDAGLRRALAEQRFHLEYQPQVDILTGRTTGLEALLRWTTEDGRELLPDSFLPEAQKLGLMEEIDAWVLDRAIGEIGALAWWRQYPMTLAVNISATSLESPEFIPRLLQLLTVHGVAPERIEVEITESATSRNPATVAGRLAELRRHGIGIAIDDFGIGYSSLSYLKDFPVTRIKIDRSFVADLAHSDSIPRAIVAVAKSLRLELVAEGVESREQAERLLSMGCDVAQGFYYQPAVPRDNLRLKYTPENAESPA